MKERDHIVLKELDLATLEELENMGRKSKNPQQHKPPNPTKTHTPRGSVSKRKPTQVYHNTHTISPIFPRPTNTRITQNLFTHNYPNIAPRKIQTSVPCTLSEMQIDQFLLCLRQIVEKEGRFGFVEEKRIPEEVKYYKNIILSLELDLNQELEIDLRLTRLRVEYGNVLALIRDSGETYPFSENLKTRLIIACPRWRLLNDIYQMIPMPRLSIAELSNLLEVFRTTLVKQHIQPTPLPPQLVPSPIGPTQPLKHSIEGILKPSSTSSQISTPIVSPENNQVLAALLAKPVPSISPPVLQISNYTSPQKMEFAVNGKRIVFDFSDGCSHVADELSEFLINPAPPANRNINKSNTTLQDALFPAPGFSKPALSAFINSKNLPNSVSLNVSGSKSESLAPCRGLVARKALSFEEDVPELSQERSEPSENQEYFLSIVDRQAQAQTTGEPQLPPNKKRKTPEPTQTSNRASVIKYNKSINISLREAPQNSAKQETQKHIANQATMTIPISLGTPASYFPPMNQITPPISPEMSSVNDNRINKPISSISMEIPAMNLSNMSQTYAPISLKIPTQNGESLPKNPVQSSQPETLTTTSLRFNQIGGPRPSHIPLDTLRAQTTEFNYSTTNFTPASKSSTAMPDSEYAQSGFDALLRAAEIAEKNGKFRYFPIPTKHFSSQLDQSQRVQLQVTQPQTQIENDSEETDTDEDEGLTLHYSDLTEQEKSGYYFFDNSNAFSTR